jgi:hypothetical protein
MVAVLLFLLHELFHSRVLEAYSGWLKAADSITTNMSQSVNAVIKGFQRKEQSPDLCLMSLPQLQLYYKAQVERRYNGFGPYAPVDVEITGGYIFILLNT